MKGTQGFEVVCEMHPGLHQPGDVILEGSVVQPQLQVVRPLPDCDVELLGAPQHILILAFPWRRHLFFPVLLTLSLKHGRNVHWVVWLERVCEWCGGEA